MIVGNSVRETRMAYVAAGDATNDTFYYYLPLLHYAHTGLEFQWTAGAGGGTATVTLEGAVQPMAYAGTPGDESSLNYADITNSVFGVASWTDDFIAVDDVGQMRGLSYIRLKLVVANKDANTTWTIYSRQSA